MKVGITGGNGFIGWHLRCFLQTIDNVSEVRIADRTTFLGKDTLIKFVNGLDIIVHLAGVNRAKDEELLSGNINPALDLVEALNAHGNKPCIVYASSTYAELKKGAYGSGKEEAGLILKKWGDEVGAKIVNLIIPHVFGEYGRPFYNSVMATFCYQIIKGEDLNIDPEGFLELIHVQDLVEIILQAAGDKNGSRSIRVDGRKISITKAVSLLNKLHEEYVMHNRLPDLSDNFVRNLFNSLRSFIVNDDRIKFPHKITDERGWLVETVKAGSGGQCFVSTTKPGVTRGNHFHRRKVERFFVLQGKAEIKIRKLFTNDVVTFNLDGNNPSFVDIPTLCTHNITNIGDNELITLFWADEFFDPENPDTYFENVV